VLVSRGGLEGPFTIDTVYGDTESGRFWYNLTGVADPLYKPKNILEGDLQKKPT
jgi:hypothetical protein